MVLAGDHRAAVESMMEKSRAQKAREGSLQSRALYHRKVVVSSDLKSATDLIGRDTYLALWEGIVRSTPGQSLPSM
jgi:hypothetical protein